MSLFEFYDLVAKAAAAIGAGLLLWPLINRMRGLDTPEEQEKRAKLRSPNWWAGFVLICVALLFQRLAAQQAGM